MDTMTQLPIAHPTLRQITIGAHILLAAWLVINGVAHEIHVLIKARAGTLNPHASVPSLLAVGAGLLIAGVIVSAGIAPLARHVSPSVLPAFAGAAAVAALIVGVALTYGTTFLGGTIALGAIDAALLVAHVMLNSKAATAGA
jgi:hypothetical protein